MMTRSLVLAVAEALAIASADGRAQALTIDTVISDMSLSSEAMVIDPKFDWQRSPKIVQYAPRGAILPGWWTGARPDWCYAALSWYTAYEAKGNTAVNTGLQIRRLRMYFLSDETRRWTLADWVDAPSADIWKYPFSPVGKAHPADRPEQPGGGRSLTPSYPYFHHGYGNTFVISEPSDVRAVFVAIDFRLVVDDPAKPDDRSAARYVVNAGADYYPGSGKSWGMDYAPGIGSGRYLLATTAWRTASLLVPNRSMSATFEEFRQNQPPLNLANQ